MYRLRFLREIANSMSGTGKVQDEFRISPAKKQASTHSNGDLPKGAAVRGSCYPNLGCLEC